MKWKKKFITCSLLVGLIILINSNATAQPSLQLLRQKSLHFSASSGVEYHKNKLYLFGDNATHLLILSPDYNQMDSVPYWKADKTVISKEDKPDIESAMIVEKGNKATLYGLGSMSDKKRWRVYEISLNDRVVKNKTFFEKDEVFPGIEEVNIEGSTTIDNTVVLCNRANEKTRRNHLLFWNWKDNIDVKEITLPKTKGTAGMSGLYYVKEKDILLFTASEEATDNAVSDGEIGDSFLGWISNFSTKTAQAEFTPDGFLKLSAFDKAFEQQKIESVCMEKEENTSLLLHLVADNDDGRSKIFKVRLTL